MKHRKHITQKSIHHSSDERIIGGHHATNCHGFAALEFADTEFNCGAVLYQNNWNQYGIITARHCWHRNRPLTYARIYPNNCKNSEIITCEIGTVASVPKGPDNILYYDSINEPVTESNDIAVASIINCR